MYDALGYNEAISNQVKMVVNSSPLTEGKYDYSKERKGVYVILIYTLPVLFPLTFDDKESTHVVIEKSNHSIKFKRPLSLGRQIGPQKKFNLFPTESYYQVLRTYIQPY